MKLKLLNVSCGFILGVYLIIGAAATVRQLPHCIENSNQGLILVSTLDGKLSALNTSGVLSWQISTDPGSLLKSNIHNLQLTNNGEWIQIIPSLTGSLYKFNGKTIDAIPITAETLLKSSFVYANDIVIAGGKEVKTYGVGLHTGHILYTCSVDGCQNKTQHDGEIDDIVIIERNTLTVRAHEPRTGSERWNFSVGHHNVKIPHHDCANLITTKIDFNITAIPPDGIIKALKIDNSSLWQKKFDSPIVDVWIWDGKDLQTIDTFESAAIVENNVKNNPLIYLAMHNKQLYIHESEEMLKKIRRNRFSENEIIESKGVLTIPWKPVVASNSVLGQNTKDLEKSTALSVLYGSDYVNGNGFYLYNDEKNDDETYSCPDNTTDSSSFDSGMLILWPLQWHWTIHLTIITAICVAYFLCNFEVKTQPDLSLIHFNSKPTTSGSNTTEPETPSFVSNYECSFDTIGCLGKGGFGVVFEAKQKIDQCGYAIKRIKLYKEEHKEVILREVRALANLDHKNIVRYFNSWFERPPHGFCYEHDKDLIESTYDDTTPVKIQKNTHKRNNSTIIDMTEMESSGGIEFLDETKSRSKDITNHDKTISKVNSKKYTSSTPSQSSYKVHTKIQSNQTEETYVGETPIYLYIQMQLCQAESLKEWLLENSYNRDKEVSLDIFKQIVDAVSYVHSKNLIHRDLKPSNIFFSLEGIIKVGDFGLVTTMDNISDNNVDINESILQSHTKGVGTKLYMSPEQIEKKKYNYKVDIYSLGVILYELMVPFSTDSERIRTLTDLRQGKYVKEFVKDHEHEFRVLENMLAKNPDNRPTTVEIQTSLFSQ